MDFRGKWHLRNDHLALVEYEESDGWRGRMLVGGVPVLHHWDSNGKSKDAEEFDLIAAVRPALVMERDWVVFGVR